MNLTLDTELAMLDKLFAEEERIKERTRAEVDAAFERLDQAFADAIEKCKAPPK